MEFQADFFSYVYGYYQSKSDYSLFIKSANSHITILLVNADDIVLEGDDLQEIASVKKVVNHLFKMKDPGPLRFFLGLEVSQSKSSIILNQRKYA